MKVCALIVDDEQMMRTLVMRGLKRAQMAEFEFIEAADGEEGFRAFDPATIDIILVDWHLPKVSGPDLCNRIRNTAGGQEVPIVMITSESGLGSMIEAAEKGDVNAYITKPFTTEDLHRKIRPIIDDLAHQRLQAEQQASRQSRSLGLFGRLFGR